jgi:cytochrome c biogenesis protein CcmG/thiol:disulfide interchange protein DsbE
MSMAGTKTMTKVFTAPAILVAMLLACSTRTAQADDVTVGQPAPDFHATTFDGRKVSLADYQGRVLIINFWATWCGPCRRELPLLDKYYQLQQHAGLEVIAVATEDSVSPSQLKPLAAAATIPFIRRMNGPYRVLKGVPTNIVIDRRGIVRYAQAGGFSLDDLNALLVPLLREQRPDASVDPGPAS